MKVLELYSGIGGMHLALNESGLSYELVASIDINTTANEVYKHNFPDTTLLNRNIEGITAEFVNDLNVDTIVMSPPCQPFTRNGLQKDVQDTRNKSFQHLLGLLKDLNVENLFIENVKDFYKSEMRNQLIDALEGAGFTFAEYILCPIQCGIPNSRSRYYCLASKMQKFDGALHEALPFEYPNVHEIGAILDEVADDFTYIPLDVLVERYKVLDITYRNAKRSCCFTKAYGRYLRGTGSVYTERSEEEIGELYKNLENCLIDSAAFKHNLEEMKLRYFTVREVCRLMSIPDTFTFPQELTNRQIYMLLGNSVNVKVVGELLKLFL